MKTIARQLKAARERTDFSQEDVAKRLGMSSVNYGDFERGKVLPSINYLADLSKILDKPITYFLEIHTDHDLSPNEKDLLDCYRSLQHTNKEIVFNFAQDLRRREEAKFS